MMHGRSAAEDPLLENSTTIVESGSKTPLSDSGTNNLVDPIKESPPPSPERWSFSPTQGSSPSSSSRCDSVGDSANNDEVITNGGIHVKDLECSLSKMEKNPNSMDAMATWPTKGEETYGEGDGTAEAEAKTWRTSSEDIVCEAPSHRKVKEQMPIDVMLGQRARSRYSAPPLSSVRRYPERATKSASPQRVRPSRYQPVYDDDDIIVLCPFMNTRLRDPVISGKNGLCVIKKEDSSSEEASYQAAFSSLSSKTKKKMGQPLVKASTF
ncbi:unnamed protein product [Strongylus vulgaris]|uniref:Uncharacterized protein n=1 Tax=Strongylus vulgaris TaxID=40348 RepID=A0A3P7J324_STRVU|nr:unnamed protein product [Strongylus vulgaris]